MAGGRTASSYSGAFPFLIPALCTVFLFILSASAFAAVPKSIVSTIGGSQPGETGGLFNTPRGVAVNQTGNGGVPAGTVYFVDSSNRRIQRIDPTGVFVSTWGWGVDEGHAEFEICTEAEECQKGEAGNGAGQFGFNGPQGIAIDQTNGNVYISDQSDRRIDIFSAKGSFEGAFGFGVLNGETALQFCTTGTGCHSPNVFSGAQGGRFGTAIGGLAIDSAGNLYVASKTNRRIDVFKPILTGSTVTGVEFLRAFGFDVETGGGTTFEVCTVAANCKQGAAGAGLGQFASTGSPADVAVDSEGDIFALDFGNKRVEEFSSVPAPITATFGSADLTAAFGSGAGLLNIAIDPSITPNHLLVSGNRSGAGNRVAVAELDHSGNSVLGAGQVDGNELTPTSANGLAVAQASLGGNIYLSTAFTGTLQGAYVLNGVPTIEPVTDITGSTARFKGSVVSNGIDVTYHFEYSTDRKKWTNVPSSEVDAGVAAETISVEQEATNLTGSQHYYVRLGQNRSAGGGKATSAEVEFTTLAAAPLIIGAVASPIKDTSATFNAYINPQNQVTRYRFEYGSADCSFNPCTAMPISEASGGSLRLVTQTITGLAPGTVYHFRLIATNPTGTAIGPDQAFETFAAGSQLPDDRAYELVTPPDTGSVVLVGTGFGESDGHDCFDTLPATASGNSVISLSKGGSLADLAANGVFDLYESVREPDGWTTISKSATSVQSSFPQGGLCSSPDHLYSTMLTGRPPGDEGSLVVEGQITSYIRDPMGTFELVGQGSEPVTDPAADVRWLSGKAAHVIFTSRQQLEPGAPPSATEGIYDRTSTGPTYVVSLLPGNTPLSAGQDAEYQGASIDGSTVAFKVGETMYVRANDVETSEVAAGPNTFGGISKHGQYVFYSNAPAGEVVNPASLFVYDVASEATTEIASNSAFVNVSEDGSRVYFLSDSVLTGGEENDQGSAAQLGKSNLYVWNREGGAINFIATVDPKDSNQNPSLTDWTNAAVTPTPTTGKGRANDSSRTNPDGSVFLFESRANITEYNSNGHVEIYRYDAVATSLSCVSCPAVGVPANADAALQRLIGIEEDAFVPTSSLVHIQNVTDDGQEVFFETKEALVPGDVNGAWDVYERKRGQQPYLISSGQGRLPTFLYGMTPSGSDVFFTSADRLVPQDASTVSSIYDARVGGGFPISASETPCQGDNCQGIPGSAPQLPGAGAGTAALQGPENQRPPRRCPKGKRRVKLRNGKARCVKRHHSKKSKRRRAHHDRGGAK